ncbi:MAG: hypothetical protein GX307_04635 [Euryarchaeota archaeon]|nr:hypothetical protein [Euryarchaeota archaeon]
MRLTALTVLIPVQGARDNGPTRETTVLVDKPKRGDCNWSRRDRFELPRELRALSPFFTPWNDGEISPGYMSKGVWIGVKRRSILIGL